MTYRRALADFILDMGVASADARYGVGQAHVIAWRGGLKIRGMSNAAICNRLAALSSLFRFLTDKQLCPFNLVSGVKRTKTGNAGVGVGKTTALTRRHVRQLLDAPMPLKGARAVLRLQQLRDRALMHL